MLEINLLPWREQRRQMRRKLGVALLVLLALAVALRIFFVVPTLVTVIPPAKAVAAATAAQPLAGIKFVGLVRQGQRVWGLLAFPDGTTHDVQIGTKILSAAVVLSINARELVLKLSNQQETVLPMVAANRDYYVQQN